GRRSSLLHCPPFRLFEAVPRCFGDQDRHERGNRAVVAHRDVFCDFVETEAHERLERILSHIQLARRHQGMHLRQSDRRNAGTSTPLKSLPPPLRALLPLMLAGPVTGLVRPAIPPSSHHQVTMRKPFSSQSSCSCSSNSEPLSPLAASALAGTPGNVTTDSSG